MTEPDLMIATMMICRDTSSPKEEPLKKHKHEKQIILKLSEN